MVVGGLGASLQKRCLCELSRNYVCVNKSLHVKDSLSSSEPSDFETELDRSVNASRSRQAFVVNLIG